jgi:hypothetical protein
LVKAGVAIPGQLEQSFVVLPDVVVWSVGKGASAGRARGPSENKPRRGQSKEKLLEETHDGKEKTLI